MSGSLGGAAAAPVTEPSLRQLDRRRHARGSRGFCDTRRRPPPGALCYPRQAGVLRHASPPAATRALLPPPGGGSRHAPPPAATRALLPPPGGGSTTRVAARRHARSATPAVAPAPAARRRAHRPACRLAAAGGSVSRTDQWLPVRRALPGRDVQREGGADHLRPLVRANGERVKPPAVPTPPRPRAASEHLTARQARGSACARCA